MRGKRGNEGEEGMSYGKVGKRRRRGEEIQSKVLERRKMGKETN